jgi:hypothetical protein
VSGDKGDRAILAAMDRRGERPVREVWWQYMQAYSRPGTPPEVVDEDTDHLMAIFSENLEMLYDGTEHARERLAELS